MEEQSREAEKLELKISAGSYDLNKFLHGGYEKDVITTIYGPAGAGKTNFCMLAAVSQAKKGNKVIFIDTEGGFSVERAKQLIGKEDLDLVLRNMMLFKPTSFKEQSETFELLVKELSQKNPIGLIVIDGIAMLYRLVLAEASQSKELENIKAVNSALARQLRTLAQIARIRNIPILVTNQVYGEFLSYEEMKQGKEKVMHMVGGDILKYWSKCILELKHERGRRSIFIRKHRSLDEKSMDFVIVNEGIKKRGWL